MHRDLHQLVQLAPGGFEHGGAAFPVTCWRCQGAFQLLLDMVSPGTGLLDQARQRVVRLGGASRLGQSVFDQVAQRLQLTLHRSYDAWERGASLRRADLGGAAKLLKGRDERINAPTNLAA